MTPERMVSIRGTCEALLELGIRPTPEDAMSLAKDARDLLEVLDKTTKERNELFLEVGKWADVPSFEYWKDRAEKAEAECAVARERLGPAGYKILQEFALLKKELNESAVMIEHALELGHLGEGSTKGWAKDRIAAIRKLVGEEE